MNEKDELPKSLKIIHVISIFVCAGSYAGLLFLKDKETLFWLEPSAIPYFGYPLLVIFLASLLFGLKGVSDSIKSLNKIRTTWLKITEEMDKKEKEKEED